MNTSKSDIIITTIPTEIRSGLKDYGTHKLNNCMLTERDYKSIQYINIYIYIYTKYKFAISLDVTDKNILD